MKTDIINKYCPQLKVFYCEEVDSTNALARALAREGAQERTLVIADRQTAGRGRLGRSFFSYDGGIYMSFILRPAISVAETLFITCAAAVAAAQTIEENFGKKALIKWVNDIYVEDKKVCGILTEGSINPKTQTLEYAILGVGINLLAPEGDFPSELTRAAALTKDKKYGLKEKIIGEFANKFLMHYVNLSERGFMAEYASRSYLDGKEIVFECGENKKSGVAVKIDRNGALIVECDDELIALTCGEAQIKEFD